MSDPKQLLNLGNGVLVISEQGGSFTVGFSEKASLGGGKAAGILSVQGEGSLVLSGKQAFDLGMALIEAHSPAAFIPIEQGIQAAGDAAISNL